jgi:hypothetical protein
VIRFAAASLWLKYSFKVKSKIHFGMLNKIPTAQGCDATVDAMKTESW